MLNVLAAIAGAGGGDWQTFAALGVVAVAAGALLWRSLGRRKDSRSGCSGSGCAAVSGDVKKLQATLRKRQAGKNGRHSAAGR